MTPWPTKKPHNLIIRSRSKSKLIIKNVLVLIIQAYFIFIGKNSSNNKKMMNTLANKMTIFLRMS